MLSGFFMESEQDCKNEINLARNLFQDLIMKDEIFPGFYSNQLEDLKNGSIGNKSNQNLTKYLF